VLLSAAQINSIGTTSDAATITIDGTGGAGTSITSAYGDISLTGQGGSNGLTSSVRNYGVFSDQAIVESTGTGVDAANIIIDGTGGAGESFNYGVLFDRDGTLSDHLTAIDGDISITGQGGSNGSMSSGTNIGVYVNDGYGIRSFGVGDNAALITIDGTGGSSGVGGNRGVRFEDSAYVTSVDGDVSITGVSDGPAGSSNNDGIVIFRGSTRNINYVGLWRYITYGSGWFKWLDRK